MVDVSSKYNGIQRRLATSSYNADVKWPNNGEKIKLSLFIYLHFRLLYLNKNNIK